MDIKRIVGFEYKGRVRHIDVLPVYEYYDGAGSAVLKYVEVTMWNRYPQSVTATGYSLENALYNLTVEADKLPHFYDYEK
ncbi:hypothetical protein BI036_gp002 [Morganella phage vB_MmoM_MP1]|uniref:Uncharacterized protein n=1 Tax=Morganella phage vB_MmoM_MP1 TaxID=1852628 RepID=A0A192YAW2_9CAUD|nr:hypothetical protein BI036_gp002 [Morganella phage vB_MmoM_MP1]ANM46618.1 hypothetical protein MP1_gp0002 [Morganella phage vB_MmoM_MP1]